MAKIFRVQSATIAVLRRRRAALATDLLVPLHAIRASCVEQYLTCGKNNCRCRRGHKHGPFHYLVQCLQTGTTRKFLLKTVGQKEQARAAVLAYADFQDKLEELSQINAELLRRGESLQE